LINLLGIFSQLSTGPPPFKIRRIYNYTYFQLITYVKLIRILLFSPLLYHIYFPEYKIESFCPYYLTRSVSPPTRGNRSLSIHPSASREAYRVDKSPEKIRYSRYFSGLMFSWASLEGQTGGFLINSTPGGQGGLQPGGPSWTTVRQDADAGRCVGGPGRNLASLFPDRRHKRSLSDSATPPFSLSRNRINFLMSSDP